MKTLKHCIISFFFVIVMTVAQAADMRTVAVISVADLDSAIATLKAVTAEAGYPDAMSQAEMQLSMLEGFDLKQSVGIVVMADDESFAGYAFLPTADISDTMLGMFLAMGEKQADGSIMLPAGAMLPLPIYVKQSGKWAFVSMMELPKTLPADPVKLLEGMDKQYLLGVKANIANLPKDKVMGMLSVFRMMAQTQAQSENDIEALDASFDQIEMALEQLKTFSFGIAVTPDNDIVIDTSAEAVAGTVLAADMTSMASFKTNQIGFYQSEDSIAAFLLAGILNAIVKQQYNTQLTTFFEGAREGVEEDDLDSLGIAAAKSVLDNVEAMLLSTIETGKIDLGTTLKKDATLLVGATITDGNKLQQALEKSLVAVPEEFQQYVKLNTEQFEGFAVSTIAVPLSDIPSDDIPKTLISKTATLQIAIKDTAIAMAFGIEDTVPADLKKAITASKTPTNVPEIVAIITPGNIADLLTLIGPIGDDEGFAEMVNIVRACPPDAQITVIDSYSGNTNKTKFVVSGKLLPGIGKFLGVSIEAAQRARQIMQERRGGDFDL